MRPTKRVFVLIFFLLTLQIECVNVMQISISECNKAKHILDFDFLPTDYNVSSPSSSSSFSSSSPTCRDRLGRTEVFSFRRRSAVMCRSFLFQRTLFKERYPITTTADSEYYQITIIKNNKLSTQTDSNSDLINNQIFNGNETLPFVKIEDDEEDYIRLFDPLNKKDFNEICSDLSISDCGRLRECVRSSIECCKKQVDSQCDPTFNSSHISSKCPSTWDGFSCWDESEADKQNVQLCPRYIKPTRLTATSMKTCLKDATWKKNNGKEWTNYIECLDDSDHVKAAYIVMSINSISIFFLFPAILLYVYFRDLIRQDRVILHVNFFASLLLSNLSHLLWTCLVTLDVLTTKNINVSISRRNPVWCRMLHFMYLYFGGTTYAWMFCEGFHLHRLISNAFVVPKSMALLYGVGWVFPMLTATTYAVVRFFIDNERCWMKQDGFYAWIIYIPNSIFVLLNFIFLLNILRVLFFQLQDQPNEPNSFRRGLKAGLMLVPLFGLQIGATVYRPDVEGGSAIVIQTIFDVLIHSQGIFVSLIFCFLSGEVLNQVKKEISSRCCKVFKTRSHLTMLTSTVNSFEGVTDEQEKNNRTNNSKKKNSFFNRRTSHKSVLKNFDSVKHPMDNIEERKSSSPKNQLIQDKKNRIEKERLANKKMNRKNLDEQNLNVELLEMKAQASGSVEE